MIAEEYISKFSVDRSEVDAAAPAVRQATQGMADSFGALGVRVNATMAAMGGGLASTSAQMGGMSASAAQAMQSVAGSSNQALAGLQNLAGGTIATGSAIGALQQQAATLSSQITTNQQVITAYSQELLTARSQMAELAARINDASVRFGSNSQSVKDLKAQYQQLSVAARGLSADKAHLVFENRALAAQMKTTTSAAGAMTGAQVNVAASSSRWGGVLNVLNGMMTTHTSQITTQRTILSGYDALVQAFVRSFGGIPVVWAAAIGIGLQLINLFGKQKEEKQKLTEITDKLIEFDLKMASAFDRASVSASGLGGSLVGTANSMSRLADINIAKAIERGIEAAARYESAGRAMISIDNSRVDMQARLTQASQSVRNAEDALTQSTTTHRGVLDSLVGDLMRARAEYDSVSSSIQGLRASEDSSLKTREESRAQLEQVSGVLAKYADLTGRTIQEVLAMGNAASQSARGMNVLSAAVDNAASSQFRYADALRAVKLAQLDASATGGGLVKLIEGSTRSIEESTTRNWANRASVLSVVDANVMHRNQLKQIHDQLKQRIATEHASELQNKNTARAQQLLNAEISKLPPVLQEHMRLFLASEKAASSFSEGQGRAKKAVSASTAAFREFGAGMKEWVQENVEGVTLTKQLWDSLSPSIQASLTRISGVQAIVQAEITRITLEEAVKQRKVLEIAISDWQRFSDEKKKIILASNIPLNLTVPGGGKPVADSARAMSEQIQASFGDMIQASAEWREAFIDDSKSIGDVMSDAPIPFKAAAEQINAALDSISEKLDNSITLQAARYGNEVASMMGNVISIFEEEAARLGLSNQEAWQHVVNKTREVAGPLSAEAQRAAEAQLRAYSEAIHRLPDVWDKILADMQKVTGKWSAETTETIRGTVSNALIILGELNLDGPVREFEKWFRVIDAGTRIVTRLLTGQAQGIIEIFSQQKTAVQTATQTINTSMTGMGNVVDHNMVVWDDWGTQVQTSTQQASTATQQASSEMVENIGRIAAAIGGLSMVFAGHQQGGIRGALTGAMGGLTAGAAIGSFFGPAGTGIGAIIGGIGGFFAGLFGGGKSELQKAQEAAQLQQAKDAVKISQQQVLQAVEDTKQSLLKTASDATELLKSIALHIDIPDDIWDSWFEDFDRLMMGFTERLQAHSSDMSEEMKATAETMQAVAGAAMAIPAALSAVNSSLGASQSQIDLVGDSWERIVIKFAQVEERVSRRIERHARKLVDSTGMIPEFVTNLAEANNAVASIQPVDASKVAMLGDTTETLLNVMSEVFNSLDRFKLRIAGQGAEMALPVLEFVASLREIQEAVTEGAAPTEINWRQLGERARAAFDFAFRLFEEIQAENLQRAAQLSEHANPVVDLISNLLDVFKPTEGEFNLSTLNAAIAGLRHAVNEMASLSATIKPETFAAAEAAAERGASFATHIQTIMQSLTASGSSQITPPSVLVDGIKNWTTGLELASKDLLRAASFASLMKATAIGINSDLSAMAASLATASSSLATSSSFTVESPAPVPRSTPTPAAKQGDTYIEIHDSVIANKAQLREMVQEAIRELGLQGK